MKDAEVLASNHWDYVRRLLVTHGENRDVIDKCAFHYKEAFIHGYKHALENLKNRDSNEHD